MSTYSEKKMDYTTISKELTYEDTESKSVDGLQLFQMLQKYADDSMAKTEVTQLLHRRRCKQQQQQNAIQRRLDHRHETIGQCYEGREAEVHPV